MTDYDARKDGIGSYYDAIAAKRAKLLHERCPAAKRVEVIGDCVLYLGDSSDIMPAVGQFGALVTDPPYGMSFRSNYRKTRHGAIENDKTGDALTWACEQKPSHSSYVFCRWDNLFGIPKPRSLVTWVKNNWSMGDLDHEHARQTEVAAFYPGPEHHWPKGRPQDVIRAPRTDNGFHPTEKPVQLMAAVVEWTAGVVCDPFMGSGTTGVACARMGRSFIGIEIDEGYFSTAVERIRKAYAQPDFFAEAVKPKAEQLSMLGEGA